jgi:hypothetical protein
MMTMRVGVAFFAGLSDSSAGEAVKSAPQYGQTSVAWLIVSSHSLQVYIAPQF